MLSLNLTTLALCLVLPALATSHVRRDDCAGFATGASLGDTCESFADNWHISLDTLKELNPGLDCDDFDDQGLYCINEGDEASSSSVPSASTSTSTSASASTSTAASTSASNATSTTDATSTPTPTNDDAGATPTSDEEDAEPTNGAQMQAPGFFGVAVGSLLWLLVA